MSSRARLRWLPLLLISSILSGGLAGATTESEYIPPGAPTIFLTAGTSPTQDTITASFAQAVTFYVRTSNIVDAYQVSLGITASPIAPSFSISGGANICSAPQFIVGHASPRTGLITCTTMCLSSSPIVITLRGVSALCAADETTPLYQAGSDILPYFVSNSTITINPGCGNNSVVGIDSAPVRFYLYIDMLTGLEYVLESFDAIDPLGPFCAASVFVEMPDICTQNALAGRFVPRSGTGPVIAARRGSALLPDRIRFTGYFPLDNLLAPGYYDLLLDLPDGGSQQVNVRFRYAGFVGYQSAGTLTNALTGNAIRGARVSIWHLTDTGVFAAYKSMVATDGTYGFSVPEGTYKVIVEYDVDGYREFEPFLVTAAKTAAAGSEYPIPYSDIALVPVSDDVVPPVLAVDPVSEDQVTARFTDAGVGMAVVEPIPASVNNVRVAVDPFSGGFATVGFQVSRVVADQPASVVMRGTDRLGNVNEHLVTVYGDVVAATGTPIVAILAGREITLRWRYDASSVDGCRLYRRIGESGAMVIGGGLIASNDGSVVYRDFVGEALAGSRVSYAYALVRDGLELGRGEEVTVTVADQLPQASLLVCAPNPFNPSTTFRLNVPSPGKVTLSIFDVRGVRVATLLDDIVSSGLRNVDWNGCDGRGGAVPSGVYFARLSSAGGVRTVKVTLAR